MSSRAALETYRKKRDFRRTPEPRGSEARPEREVPREFVVQKHGARRLHYDFRLELDGVLKSWAVPKGPSLVAGERRLAVATEDHPIAYASFEGVIPDGEYGAGPVVVWDRGYWFCEDDPHLGLARGRIDFTLAGEKLRGGWRLVRMKDGDDWLLMKRRDPAAHAGDADALVRGRPASVLSGRDLEEVRASADRRWRASDVAPRPPALGDPSGIEGAKKRPLPETFSVQLATLVAEPSDEAHLNEMKLDGYRIVCVSDGERVRLLSRRGHDWTARFASIARDARHFAGRSVVLDGEAVVLDQNGIPDFQALQNAAGRDDLLFYAFDLLYLDGYDLRPAPLRARKEALRLLLAATPGLSHIRFSDHVEGRGRAFFEHACAIGLEGIIQKRADAPYRAGRNRNFTKVKCRARDDFVVVGFTAPEGSRVGFRALVLATRQKSGPLRHAGKVGTGFSDQTLRDLTRRLEAIERRGPPIPVDLPPRERKRIRWVEPRLVVEIAFHGFTRKGTLRHAAFVGLRDDKEAREVLREQPASPTQDEGPPDERIRRARAASREEMVAGVRLSHPEKVLFPEQGLTKRALAEYYAEIADVVLPGLVDRPLTLLRCPDGRHGDCFFQKQANRSVPNSLPRVRVKAGVDYLAVRKLEDLIALVQLGVLELHVWGARADRIERPDILVFDLDPDDGVPWAHLRTTAEVLRERLAQLGLTAFARVTGGKGLHVVTPIERRVGWDEVRAFTRGVADELVRAAPQHYTANLSKKQRRGKIFVDYLRNAPEATAIASYSVRAREGAHVASPIEWSELAEAPELPRRTVQDVVARVRAGRDPWVDFDAARGRLTKAALEAVGAR